MNQPTTPVSKDWVNILFLTLTPLLGVFGTAAWTMVRGFDWWMPALMIGLYLLVGLSVTAGYHRFFSHKSYEASPLAQAFFAFFGAMAAQNSILWWSSSHRVHHKYVDRDWDPYNIQRGFWWAHILWIFYRNPDAGNFENARDLENNPIVMWQHRWHKVIMIVGGFGIPTADRRPLRKSDRRPPLGRLLASGADPPHDLLRELAGAHLGAGRSTAPSRAPATTGPSLSSPSGRDTTASITASPPISATASSGTSGTPRSGSSARFRGFASQGSSNRPRRR